MTNKKTSKLENGRGVKMPVGFQNLLIGTDSTKEEIKTGSAIAMRVVRLDKFSGRE